MDSLSMNSRAYKLIAQICAFFFAVIALSASAAIEPKETFVAARGQYRSEGATAEAACLGFAPYAQAIYYDTENVRTRWYSDPANGLPDLICSIGQTRVNDGSWRGFSGVEVVSVMGCPANSVSNGSQCLCSEGFNENNGQCVKKETQCALGSTLKNGVCVDDCAELTGRAAGVWNVEVGQTPSLGPKQVCDTRSNPGKQCMVTGEADFCGSNDGKNYSCTFTGKYKGGGCTPDDKADPNIPSNDKVAKPADNSQQNAGKCPGTVNGVTVYVSCNSTASKSDTSTVNGDPPVTTNVSEKVTCDANNCSKVTTTTTINNNGSSSTSSSTTTGTKDAVCAGSKAPGCTGSFGTGSGSSSGDGDGKESTFGGSCKAGFTCDGDAATCAIAKAANDSKCRLFELTDGEDTTSLALGKALAAGTDTSIKDPKTAAGGAATISMKMLQDVANPYGESCPGNIPITVAGHSIVIPLADYCNILRNLGNVLWASTIFATTIFVLKGQG